MQNLHQSQPGHWCFPTLNKVYLKSVITLRTFSLICFQWQAIDITVGLGLQQSMEHCSKKRNKNVVLIQILPCMSRMNRCGTCSNTHRVRVLCVRCKRFLMCVCDAEVHTSGTVHDSMLQLDYRSFNHYLVLKGRGGFPCLSQVGLCAKQGIVFEILSLEQGVKSPISLLILLYGRFRKWSCYLGICFHPLRQIIPLTHKLKLPVIYESFAIIPVFSRGSIKHKR